MLKKIKNLNGVIELQKQQQRELTGGAMSPFLSDGDSVTVICTCSDGSSWAVGTADSSDVDAIRGFGDECRADGGSPSGF